MGGAANPQMVHAQCSSEPLFVITAPVPFLIVGSCNRVLFTCESCSSLILFSTEVSHFLCFSASLTEAYLVGVDSNIFFSLKEFMRLENLQLLPFKHEIWMSPIQSPCRACLFASTQKRLKHYLRIMFIHIKYLKHISFLSHIIQVKFYWPIRKSECNITWPQLPLGG